MPMDSVQQYGRVLSLIVFGASLDGLDLSELRIKFSVKTTLGMTPNMADIRVYNVSEDTAILIKKEFKKVILQAGYEANFGIIFQGNIKQVIIGRESATDTFIDILAGDGDKAYNHAIVNTTLAAGSSQLDQKNALVISTTSHGVTAGNLGADNSERLPRAKVMYGNVKTYMRRIAEANDEQPSIQQEKLTFQPLGTYAKGEAVTITAQTGQIGTPQQTNEGVNVKCLLNPKIQIGGRIHLDNSKIEQQKLNLEQIALAAGNVSAINQLIPRRLNADGIYMPYALEHTGDTRGIEWYTSMICLNIDVSANPFNSVSTG